MPASALRLILALSVALAVISLIAYARGDDGDDGRSPELGAGRAAAVVVQQVPT
jgi:hypothetical protein